MRDRLNVLKPKIDKVYYNNLQGCFVLTKGNHQSHKICYSQDNVLCNNNTSSPPLYRVSLVTCTPDSYPLDHAYMTCGIILLRLLLSIRFYQLILNLSFQSQFGLFFLVSAKLSHYEWQSLSPGWYYPFKRRHTSLTLLFLVN